MSWNRAVQIFKAIVIIMIIVVFGIMGYWQIQLNKNGKKLDELKIKIEKLKSSKYLKNNKLLFEEDYYDLMFIYIVYLKEDLASLIEKY